MGERQTLMLASDMPALEAVRWALAAYLSPQDVQRAAALWQPSAPGSSSMAGLSRYCREVGRQFNLQGREAELHLHIIRALQAVARSAPASPQPTSPQAPSSQPPGDSLPGAWSNSRPWLASDPAGWHGDAVAAGASATARLVQHVIEAMGDHAVKASAVGGSPAAWRQAVVKGFRQARLRGPQAHRAQAWLEGEVPHLAGDWPPRGDGTRLINAAYVALAECLGPVQADACLTRIVRHCEQGGVPELQAVRSYL